MRLLRPVVPIVLFAVALSGCDTSPEVIAPRSPDATGTLTPQSAPDVTYQYEELDVPTDFGTNTGAYGINNSGTIVGDFLAPDGSLHGFLIRRDRFLDVTVPGAAFDKGSLLDVNDPGTAVGLFYDAGGVAHGYVRAMNGTITVLPDPAPGTLSLFARGINNAGTIVGAWISAGPASHGFIWKKGVYTSFDYPGALITHLNGINNQGQIVGAWSDGITDTHSFLLDGSSVIEIAVPGASTTYASSINNSGDITGYYYNNNPGQTHGFVRSSAGQITTLDFPGAPNTATYGINDRGMIVGSYDSYTHGMVLSPENGEISVITID